MNSNDNRTKNNGYVKALRLKQVGIVLAGLCVIILIAAASAIIYREFDGPTIRSSIAENLELSSAYSTLDAENVELSTANSTLNADLDSARKDAKLAKDQFSLKQQLLDRLAANMPDSRLDNFDFDNGLDSYLFPAPLVRIGP